MNWKEKNVLVTGGTSFIGSNLVNKLVNLGANIRVIDDLSSGKLENIQQHINDNKVEFIKGDLRDTQTAKNVVSGMNIVFHLAADHGGRGYVDLHQAACATNLLLDTNVFKASYNAGVEKVVFASSGCVYPNFLQSDPKKEYI